MASSGRDRISGNGVWRPDQPSAMLLRRQCTALGAEVVGNSARLKGRQVPGTQLKEHPGNSRGSKTSLLAPLCCSNGNVLRSSEKRKRKSNACANLRFLATVSFLSARGRPQHGGGSGNVFFPPRLPLSWGPTPPVRRELGHRPHKVLICASPCSVWTCPGWS